MNVRKTILVTERFSVEEVTRTFAAGDARTRTIIKHPGAVAVIPLTDDRHVCLIENYRVAVEQTLLEIVAGTLEPGESPLATARRELQEETGYRARSIERIASFYMSPGILDERIHLFVATGLTAGDAARETGEEIENRIVPWDEAIALIFSGRIVDAKTIAALLMYDRIRHGHADCAGKE